MQLIFTFTANTETKEMVFAGNMEPQAALSMLQQLVIADAINKAQAAKSIKENKEEKKDEPNRV